MGKVIVIEGVDGSGKGTQSKLLSDRLKQENYDLFNLTFPQYHDESSYFVRQYLSGAYGTTAASVSAKQASLCYAMDRFHAFKADKATIEAVNNPNKILLANRYTTSNILFQATKAKTVQEIYDLIDWICETEYGILEIPKPDMVIMPVVEIEKNIEMMKKRDVTQNAKNNNMSKDIHELDLDYLRRVHEASQIVADRMGFEIIDCMDQNGDVRTIEDIHNEIYTKVDSQILRLVKKK